MYSSKLKIKLKYDNLNIFFSLIINDCKGYSYIKNIIFQLFYTNIYFLTYYLYQD